MCSQTTGIFAGRKPLEGREERELWGRYTVGDDGIVRSDGVPLKPVGGVWVCLGGKRRKVAYLVARAFLPNAEGRPWVRHLNGDVLDHRACNLEWSEEREDRRLGPRAGSVGRYVVEQYDGEGELVATYGSVWEASRLSGVGASAIRNCLAGRARTAGGYVWGKRGMDVFGKVREK